MSFYSIYIRPVSYTHLDVYKRQPLSNPAMLNTVGKVTSLKAGSKLANIPLDKIKQTLIFNGYDVIGD